MAKKNSDLGRDKHLYIGKSSENVFWLQNVDTKISPVYPDSTTIILYWHIGTLVFKIESQCGSGLLGLPSLLACYYSRHSIHHRSVVFLLFLLYTPVLSIINYLKLLDYYFFIFLYYCVPVWHVALSIILIIITINNKSSSSIFLRWAQGNTFLFFTVA